MNQSILLDINTPTQDMTEHLELKRLLAQRTEELRLSEERFKQLLNYSPTVVYTINVNPEYLVTFISDNISTLLGYKSSNFAENGKFWLEHIHPEDKQRVLRQKELTFVKIDTTIEYRILHSENKNYVWVKDNARIIRDEQGNIKQIIGSFYHVNNCRKAAYFEKDNESRFQLALRNFPLTVFSQNKNLRYTWLYSSFFRDNLVLGKKDADIFDQEDGKKLTAIKQEVLEKGEGIRQEISLKINGVEKYFDVNYEPMYNDQGEIIGITGAEIDISARMKAEKVILELNEQVQTRAKELEIAYDVLAETESFLDQVINSIDDPIFVKDKQHRWRFFNQSFCQLIGKSPEEILGKSDYDYFPREQANIFWEKDDVVLTTGVVNENEEYLTDTQGNLHFISTKKTRFFDSNNNPYIVSVIRDLTERKKTEEALERSQARFERIATNSPGVIFQVIQNLDGGKKLTYISDRCEEILELTAKQLQRNLNFVKGYIHPEDLPNIDLSMRICSRELQSFDEEWRYITPGGKLKWIEGIAEAEKTENGEIIWDGILLDITERKQSEEKLLEQLSLQSLRLDISNFLTKNTNLQSGLQLCTDALVKNLDIAFARIWLYNEQNNVLELQANSGRDTRLNEKYSIIEMGQYQVGKIAQSRCSIVNNCFREDKISPFQHWTKRKKMMAFAFAGYPILLGDKLIGVIGIFATYNFSETIIKEIELISNLIAWEIEKQSQQEELQKLALIIENSKDFIGISDLAGNLTYFNPAGCKALGISFEGIPNTKIMDFLPESQYELINNEVIPEVMTQGQWRGESQLRHFQTNELIDVDIMSFLVKNPQTNQPVGMATVQRDIRERKKRDLYLTTLVEIQRLLLADQGKNDLEKYIFDLIGTTFNISRIVLLENDPNSEEDLGRKINYQWCAEGLLPIDENIYNLASLNKNFSHILSLLKKGEIFTGIVSEMSEPERSFFVRLGAKKIITFPVIIRGRLWGIFNIQDCENHTQWSQLEIKFLTTTVNAIAMAKERQLNQAQLQKQLTAIETVKEGISIKNNEAKYLYANPAYLEIFGYDNLEQILGKDWHDDYDSNDVERLQNELSLSVKQTGKYQGEWRAKKQNGSKFIAEFTITMINDGSVVCIVRDITQRKQAEKALRESEERYRQIVETALEGIWVIDANANTTYVNPQLSKMLGYQEVEMIDKSLYDFMNQNAYEQALINMERRSHGIAENHDFCFTRKDGSQLWTMLSTAPLFGDQGEFKGALAMITDITEKKQAEEDLRLALEKEKELNQLKTQFIDIASHEFRTPLTIILGSSEFLLNKYHKLPEEKKFQHLNNIQSGGKRMKSLIDDILAISRADSGNIKPDLSLVHIPSFCHDLIEELQVGILEEHHLQFVMDNLPSDNIWLDEKILHHILSNLLSNAAKYSPQLSTIDLLINEENNQLIFQVKDRGIGIPESDQPYLFQSFHRASNVGKISGTGLGLNIVKKYVEIHGGNITFESEVGLGTTFTVTIPINN